MTKVFILLDEAPAGYTIVGVYSTREKAEARAIEEIKQEIPEEEIDKEHLDRYGLIIEEWEVED